VSSAAESVQTVGLFAGRHVIAELDRVDPMLLNDELFLRRAVQQVLHRAGATVLTVVSKRFCPQGVTVLALLSESHASLHTYPEFSSMFVDVFTCGTRADPERAVRLLAEALGNPPIRIETIQRGWQKDEGHT
jgi:S-adenosylmethionine decarboxylase